MTYSNETSSYEISIFHGYHQKQQLNNDYCILFVFSGSVQIRVNNKTYRVEEQQLLALHPQEHYSIHADDNTTAAWIRFRYNFFTKAYRSKHPHLNLSAAAYHENIYHVLVQKTLYFIDKYFQNDADSIKYTITLEYIQFLKENAVNENTNPLPLSKKEERALFIEDHIESNYMNPLSLNDLADLLQLTPQYLAAFIKKNMHTTFNQYLYKVRLSHAVRDMIATNDSLTHIAFNHGFPNIATFNRIFKEGYQRTPQSYRNQYKKNIEFLNINETPFPNYKVSQQLYKNYCNKQKELQQKIEKKTHIHVDTQSFKKWEHIWSKTLNVGYAKDLNNFAMIEHLRTIINDIPFTHGRITGLVHPDMMPYLPESKIYDFREVDTILDILFNLRLKPFIVLGKPEPVFNNNHQPHYVYSSAEYTDFSKAFTAFVRHCVMRYSADEFEQWKFEFSYNLVEEGNIAQNHIFHKYIKNSCEAYRILKQESDKIAFGGPGHRLAQSDDHAMEILKIWKDHGVIPDFFTVFAYPLERMNTDSPSPLKPISTNPHIHRSRILEVQQHLNGLYGYDIPVYITELGFHFCNKKYILDSLFSAAYIIQNIADLWDLCTMIMLPAASDLHYRPLSSTQFLFGGNGIISIDGIKKPAYFALMFLKNMGSQLLYKAPGVLVSRHRDMSYRILLYNYKHPSYYYCAHPEYEIPENLYEEIFIDNQPAEFNLPLNFLPENQYFIIEYTLDKEHGSIMDKWIACGKGQNLLNHMILHLKQITDIGFTYQPIQVTKETALNYSVRPHDIKLITIYPVNSQ